MASIVIFLIVLCGAICSISLVAISVMENPAGFDPIGAIKDKIASAKWKKQMLKDMKALQEKLDADRIRNLKL